MSGWQLGKGRIFRNSCLFAISAHKALSGANPVVNAAATTVADVFPHRFANMTVSTCGGGSTTATSEHAGQIG